MWTCTLSLSRTNKYRKQCLIVSSRHIEYDVPLTDEKNKVILMEYITLRLDSTNEVEQWYVRHSYFYCLIT